MRLSAVPSDVKFHDLPPEMYPFTVTATGVDSGKVHWRETVEGPCVLHVPPLAEMHGEAIAIRVDADGASYEEEFPVG